MVLSTRLAAAAGVVAVFLSGCGGGSSQPSGEATADPSAAFRAQVHAAYDRLAPDSLDPVGHRRATIGAWQTFQASVTAADVPDQLVSAKQQLLRDVAAVIAAIGRIDVLEGSDVFGGGTDYGAVQDDIDAEEDAEAAVQADVDGL